MRTGHSASVLMVAALGDCYRCRGEGENAVLLFTQYFSYVLFSAWQLPSPVRDHSQPFHFLVTGRQQNTDSELGNLCSPLENFLLSRWGRIFLFPAWASLAFSVKFYIVWEDPCTSTWVKTSEHFDAMCSFVKNESCSASLPSSEEITAFFDNKLCWYCWISSSHLIC